ncbi:EAL domain-containing protein [Gammaproteobacteria bacterium AB-CW1]|uniref:EAL domain-containing protein n=2 Tax=Natronospira TaxID=2024969 RepID=A0AAP6JEU7_9GAMM|nr:EAL domain-containing protein [Gammaproteobacteria bacterium AB-CW1]
MPDMEKRGDFHRYLMDNIADAFYLHDRSGRILEANQAACRHTGYSRSELLGMSVSDLNPYRDPAEIDNLLAEMVASPGAQKVFRSWHRHKSGERLAVEVNLVRLNHDGHVLFLASVRDAREWARLEGELEHKIAFNDLLLDFSTRLISVTPDRIDSVIQDVLADIGAFFNAGRSYLFSIDLDAGTFSNTHEWSAPSVPPEIGRLQNLPFEAFPWLMGNILKGNIAHLPDVDMMDDQYRVEREEYKLQSIRSLIIVPLMKDGRPRGLFGLDAVWEKRFWPEDIRNNLRLLGQLIASAIDAVQFGGELEYLAYHDPLTELPNRKLLYDRIDHAIAESTRTNSMLAVMLLDLDDFKLINDSFSHNVGDQFLRHTAQRLESVCRAGDTLSRLGGDEFVLLMEVEEAADAARVAERALDLLTSPIDIEGEKLIVHSSIGIAIYPDNGGDSDTLIRNADLAMYEAKASGKNRYAFFDQEMTERAQASLSLRHDLERALDSDELCLYFQARVDIARSRICGLEALIRWNHPSRGLLQPADFLPLAERSDLICRLDHWVLKQACRESRQIQKDGPDFRIAINLSARDLYETKHLQRLIATLEVEGTQNPLPLEIEITESILMHDVELAMDNLRRIKAAAPDVTIAIDDFGSGYSSLNYLRQIPMDTLKIDRAFIADLGTENGGAAAIVRSIVELARNLNLHVVAEGVETEAQLGLLRELGVEEAQGFLFGRPAPIANVLDASRAPGFPQRREWNADNRPD